MLLACTEGLAGVIDKKKTYKLECPPLFPPNLFLGGKRVQGGRVPTRKKLEKMGGPFFRFGVLGGLMGFKAPITSCQTKG